MTDVRALVFDVGNVLIEWDPRHLYRKIFDDEDRMEWFLAEVCPPDWNIEQDRGRLIVDAEQEALSRYPDLKTEICAFYGRFQEMIPGAIMGTVEILKAAKAKVYPVYALTNFSAETFVGTRERFEFFDQFDGILVSGEEGLIKPDARIYALLADRFDLEPNATVFVDDSIANIASASEFGFQAHLFTASGVFRDWLLGRGVTV